MGKDIIFRFGHRLRMEWTWFPKTLAMYVGIGEGEHALTFGIQCILFSAFFTFAHLRLGRWLRDKTKRRGRKYGDGREFRLYVYERALWFCLWHDPMESRSADPWHVRMHVFDPVNMLFGNTRYSSKCVRTERVIVPMPEGGYPATVQFNTDTWKRPRWPWPKTIMRAKITPDTPIPHPGRGESAWDCVDDATHSLYLPCESALDAAMAMSRTVMQRRVRYGGWTWMPAQEDRDGA